MPLRSSIGDRQSAISSFTLVELLVVLVIIGMLAGLGLTAMQHIGRAQALSTGARQFANHINMARNYAVVNSTYLYLMVATDDTMTNNTEYAYSAYTFCTPVNTNSLQSGQDYTNLVAVEDWQFLPRGVVFDSKGTNFVETKVMSFPAPSGGTNLWMTWGWVVTFTPNGQILPLSRRPSFTLFEGVVSPSTMKSTRTGVSTNNYQIEINPLIGKPIVSRFP